MAIKYLQEMHLDVFIEPYLNPVNTSIYNGLWMLGNKALPYPMLTKFTF